MIDAHQFAGAPDALKALDKTLDSVWDHLPPRGLSRAEQYARPHKDESFCWDEPYTLPENAFLAFKRGAGKRYKRSRHPFPRRRLVLGPARRRTKTSSPTSTPTAT